MGLHAYCALDLVLPKGSHAAASSTLPLLRQVSLLLGPGCSVKHGTRLKTGNPDSWLLHLKPGFQANQAALALLALKTLQPPPSPA